MTSVRKPLLAASIAAAFASPLAAHAQSLPAPTAGPLEIWSKAPLANATVSGTLSGDKCYVKGYGVSRVQFFLDSTALNTDTVMSDGMSCVLDTTKFGNGTHTLKAVAYDSSGRTYTETWGVNIQNTVTTPTTPTPPTPPTTPTTSLPAPGTGTLDIWYKAPLAGATVSGTLSGDKCYIKGNGVARVSFFMDSTALNTDTVMSDGMSCVLDTTRFANGTHTLKAVAYDASGRTYTETMALNVQNGSSSTPTPSTPPTGGAAIAAADILDQAHANAPFSGQSGYEAQTIGTYTRAAQIPETGIHGFRLPNGETLRVGKVTDPANSAKKALAFQLSPNDPYTSGSKRAEFAFYPNMELDKTYWIAFRIYAYDWGTLPSGDESLFGMQIHSGDDNRGLSPSLALVVAPGGREYEVISLFGTNLNPTPRDFIKTRHVKKPIPFGKWADIVVKVRQSNSASNGLLQVWQDGAQIVDYKGGIGFNTPGYKDYMKYGYYNWSTFNSPRKVLLQEPVLVLDPTGSKYAANDLRTYINK